MEFFMFLAIPFKKFVMRDYELGLQTYFGYFKVSVNTYLLWAKFWGPFGIHSKLYLEVNLTHFCI